MRSLFVALRPISRSHPPSRLPPPEKKPFDRRPTPGAPESLGFPDHPHPRGDPQSGERAGTPQHAAQGLEGAGGYRHFLLGLDDPGCAALRSARALLSHLEGNGERVLSRPGSEPDPAFARLHGTGARIDPARLASGTAERRCPAPRSGSRPRWWSRPRRAPPCRARGTPRPFPGRQRHGRRVEPERRAAGRGWLDTRARPKHNPRGRGPACLAESAGGTLSCCPFRLAPCPHQPAAGSRASFSSVSPLRAQEKRPLRIDDLFALRDVSSPQIAPDGASVVFTVRSMDVAKDKSDTDIYRVPMAGGDAVRLTSSPKPETRPRFSPDGRQIAFLSGREGKKSQVFLLPVAGGEAVKLTDYKGGVSDFAWSPDGDEAGARGERPRSRRAAGRGGQGRRGRRQEDAQAHRPATASVQARRGGLPPRPSHPPPRLRRERQDHGPGHDRRVRRFEPGVVARRAGPRLRQQPHGRAGCEPEHRHLPGGAPRGGHGPRAHDAIPPRPARPRSAPTASSWPTWRAAIPRTCGTARITSRWCRWPVAEPPPHEGARPEPGGGASMEPRRPVHPLPRRRSGQRAPGPRARGRRVGREGRLGRSGALVVGAGQQGGAGRPREPVGSSPRRSRGSRPPACSA